MAFKGIIDKDIDTDLKINQNFAKSFEKRKFREEVQKAKKRAEELELYSGSDVPSSESEDSSAELLTSKANGKFLEVLSMIKQSDPRLKNPEFKAFSDSDFDSSEEKANPKEKPIRYKELLTQTLINPTTVPKMTHIAEQKQLKNDFLEAVDNWNQSSDGSFLIKRKTKDQKNDFEDLAEIHQKKAEVDAIKKYWSASNNDDDLFLKKFVLKKLWKDPKDSLLTYDEIVEKEDSKNTNETEKFETAYNFRFEEEGFEKLKSNLKFSLFSES